MDLASHQRILLGLMRASFEPGAADAPYYHLVAASVDLQEARGNVYLWRVFVLERTCVLTVALLRQRGLLEPALQDFIRLENVSPFREYQPLAFLAGLAGHADLLVRCVAQFELALMKVREGDAGTYTLDWPRGAGPAPAIALHALAQGAPLPAGDAQSSCRITVSAALPHLFEINSVELASAN